MWAQESPSHLGIEPDDGVQQSRFAAMLLHCRMREGFLMMSYAGG
jgi:hypothetical protein